MQRRISLKRALNGIVNPAFGDLLEGRGSGLHLCNPTPQRGDWYCNPGWRLHEERSSEERPQPGDGNVL
ncbi:MAG: hypothetical protein GVY07_01595 [Bacteroidetes bacterium]|nr:hypothetical protein [Bacteroidota bacterium]